MLQPWKRQPCHVPSTRGLLEQIVTGYAMRAMSSDHADKYKYGVVRHFVGHGVGQDFHSGPAVLHYSRLSATRSPPNMLDLLVSAKG